MYSEFTAKVWAFYKQNRRAMPWRDIEQLSIRDRGYRVMVSEVMLQQTQVSRVLLKYDNWMRAWPTIDDFMRASLADVLMVWNGLGYNSRAKYLYDALTTVYEQHGGIVPNTIEALTTLPGIGNNTAGAILVYTYNEPIVFVETNIRTVYLSNFYTNNENKVTDAQICRLVAETLDMQNPREWYYALMDYGAYIKKSHGSTLHKAVAYKKQTVFHGSNRQIRGKVLFILTNVTDITRHELYTNIADDRLDDVLQTLLNEGLIVINSNGRYSLPNVRK